MSTQRDKEVLGLKFPEDPGEDIDYLLTVKSLLETEDFVKEMEVSQNSETHPKLTEAKEKLLTAINAASGMQKIIEQLHSKGADVRIPPHEKEVKRAIKRVFKTDKGEITFQMYQQAIAKLRDISETIKQEVINEQVG